MCKISLISLDDFPWEIKDVYILLFLQEKIHPTQEKMGKLLFNMIKKDRLHLLRDMKYFDFYVVSPQFRNLGE